MKGDITGNQGDHLTLKFNPTREHKFYKTECTLDIFNGEESKSLKMLILGRVYEWQWFLSIQKILLFKWNQNEFNFLHQIVLSGLQKLHNILLAYKLKIFQNSVWTW